MNEVVMLDINSLRKSVYNPRIVQDPDRARILLESVKREGVKQPLLVHPSGDGFYEVLDGSRRLEAARQAGIKQIPCIVFETSQIPQTSLAIHFSQEDLTEEELVLYVERLVAEEIFPTVEDVCRFLGVSKTWFYTLKKAVKLKPAAEKIPTTSLAMVEKTDIDEEKKKQVIEALETYPLPRQVLQHALDEIVEKQPQNPVEIIEKHYLMTPRKTDDDTVSASATYEYLLRRNAGVVEFVARRGVETVWRIQFPAGDLPVVKLMMQKL